jgi:aminopeptidase N
MAYVAEDALFPEWRMWEHFVNRELGSALRRDSLPNVQSVRTGVRHPDEIQTLFDPSIVYAKGASVLRMLFYLVGEEGFRKGLKNYFEKHQYKNTEASDLWDSLSAVSSFDVREFMDHWLNKPGYPALTVSYEPNQDSLEISQSRLIVGEKGSDDSTVWQVPLLTNAKLNSEMLAASSAEFKIEKPAKNTLLLNDEATAYTVVRYKNPKHFKAILADVEKGNVSTIDKMFLLQSYSLLEKANLVKTVDNLKILEAFHEESEETVWSAMAGVIASARLLVSKDKETEPVLYKMVSELTQPMVDKLGWESEEDESAQTVRLRDLILTLSAAVETHSTIDEGLKRFRKFEKPADLSPDIRNVVYFIGAKYGNQADFEKLLKLHETIENADEKDEIVSSITTTRDSSQIDKLLSLITSPSVRLQDAVTWFVFLLRNPDGKEKTWQWMVDNWAWIEKSFTDDKSFDRFPRYAGGVFSKKDELKLFKDFFDPMKSIIALERSIQLGEEEINGRIKWRDNNEVELKQWLKARKA